MHHPAGQASTSRRAAAHRTSPTIRLAAMALLVSVLPLVACGNTATGTRSDVHATTSASTVSGVPGNHQEPGAATTPRPDGATNSSAQATTETQSAEGQNGSTANVTITGLPSQPVFAAGGPAQEFTVRLAAGTSSFQSVAQQILVETPEAGPNFASPDNAVLELYDPAAKTWQRLTLGQQTGTLFTTIPTSGTPLNGGSVQEVRYRLAFTKATPAMNGPLKLDVLVYSLPDQLVVATTQLPFTLKK
jgi:hypothetical protein